MTNLLEVPNQKVAALKLYHIKQSMFTEIWIFQVVNIFFFQNT